MLSAGQMEPQIRDYLLRVARTYAEATGLALATVSRRFHGTDSFFSDFAVGKRTITLRKADQMLVAFAAGWPAKTQWPSPPKSIFAAKTTRQK